jgi:hypothetical protein
VVFSYLGKAVRVSRQSEAVLNFGKSLSVVMAKVPAGIQALANISLEQFILKQNSKYPNTLFIVVSNLWFH